MRGASGELPPDFGRLPSNAYLPDVLAFNDGNPVESPGEWEQRRQEVIDILRHYQRGSWPPPPPKMIVEELDSLEDEALGGVVKLILAPTLDQDWVFQDVEACYEAALTVYRLLGRPDAIQLRAPHVCSRYAPNCQDKVNDWLWEAAQGL
jgi:hypothetical protein